MLGWLLNRLRNVVPRCPWTVTITDHDIVIDDGQGTRRSIPIVGLRKVVVATDDSGPWDYDVVFLLFNEAADPQGIFPLEAAGVQEFVRWLGTMPGYRDRELSKAMASTRVARFTVMERPD